MMPMNKRRYSKDFREQALSKVYSRPDEQNIDDIATELHMNVGTLKGWMRKATKDQKGPPRQAVKAADFTLAERLLAPPAAAKKAMQKRCEDCGALGGEGRQQ